MPQAVKVGRRVEAILFVPVLARRLLLCLSWISGPHRARRWAFPRFLRGEFESEPAARRSRAGASVVWGNRRGCPRPGGVLCGLTSGPDRGRGEAVVGLQPHEGVPVAAGRRVSARSEAWESDRPHDLFRPGLARHARRFGWPQSTKLAQQNATRGPRSETSCRSHRASVG